MPPAVELPLEVWQRIAVELYNDSTKKTYEDAASWKGAAILSSVCRATRSVHHTRDIIKPESLSELVWFVKHWPPHLTHMAIFFGNLFSYDAPSMELRDVVMLDVVPCLQRFRELHIQRVDNIWDTDDTMAWLTAIMLSAVRTEVFCLDIERFAVMPRMQQLKHLTITIRSEVAPTCSRSLQCLPQLETLAVTAIWYYSEIDVQSGQAYGLHIDALNLSHSKHLRGVYFAFVMPAGLSVPQGCAVHVYGHTKEVRPHWDWVRQVCTECTVVTMRGGCLGIYRDRDEANVSFLLEQPSDRMSRLQVACYSGEWRECALDAPSALWCQCEQPATLRHIRPFPASQLCSSAEAALVVS